MQHLQLGDLTSNHWGTSEWNRSHCLSNLYLAAIQNIFMRLIVTFFLFELFWCFDFKRAKLNTKPPNSHLMDSYRKLLNCFSSHLCLGKALWWDSLPKMNNLSSFTHVVSKQFYFYTSQLFQNIFCSDLLCLVFSLLLCDLIHWSEKLLHAVNELFRNSSRNSSTKNKNSDIIHSPSCNSKPKYIPFFCGSEKCKVLGSMFKLTHLLKLCEWLFDVLFKSLFTEKSFSILKLLTQQLVTKHVSFTDVKLCK